MRSRIEPHGKWEAWNGFRVLPDQPHAFDAKDAQVAMLFMESEGAEYACVEGRLHTDECIVPFQPPHPAAAGLATLAAEGGTIDEADAICRAWLGLGSVNASGRGRDARIVRALQVLQSAIDRPVRLQSLANQLNVSPSWLSHRFVEETGVPLRHYVVVDDPLPAGMEAVNATFATTSAATAMMGEGEESGEAWWYGFTHVEKHDDRVLLFADWLPEGAHSYTYLMRATTPGAFTLPPARAGEMYKPEVYGRTPGGKLRIE